MKKQKILVFLLLILCGTVAVLSIREASLTFDEKAHIAAGYSYLVKRDMRVNPEHPPLLKNLSALPLLLLEVNFPEQSWESVRPDIWWQQFDFGTELLYRSGNDPHKMIFWARLPMIGILVAGGIYTYLFAKKFWSEKAALLALTMYALSPTLIAHGRLVNTDVGIAAATLISFYYFLGFLENPSRTNTILAGLGLGLAQIVKFTGVFLVPVFALLGIVWVLTKGEAWLWTKRFVAVFLVASVLVYGVYLFHVWQYPGARQAEDISRIIGSSRFDSHLEQICSLKILQPVAQYLTGLGMVLNRGTGGNTTFFLGQMSAQKFPLYFPVLWLLKIPLAFHIITLFALFSFLLSIEKEQIKKPVHSTLLCIKSNFISFSLFSFILFYWAITLSGNLNIGVRHMLPVIPLTILLVSRGTMIEALKPGARNLKYGALIGLLAWQAFSISKVYPDFIAYYNELAGGPEKGHLYAVDSNLDWGQDLGGLREWATRKEIDQIYIDYFGGGDLQYYFGDKFIPWKCTKDPEEMQRPAYLAVSATQLQGGRAKAVRGFQEPTTCYNWLYNEQLIKKIGYSIFVYYVE